MKLSGYSGTPLPQKLGLKPGQRVHFVNAPPEFAKLLGPSPDDVEVVERPTKPLDFVVIFVTSAVELTEKLPKLITALTPAGMIWVSWPKKASGVPTDLTENVIRDIALAAGVVDVKVCAISEIWSGLKLVIRLKDRKT
ncbi:MAG: DUF3052 family protein [Gemmataceae bacterium]